MSTALVAPKSAAEQLAKRLEESLPRFIQLTASETQARRICAVIQNAWARDPYLQECTPSSVIQASVQCVELGLDPSPQLGQFYFIPRNVKVRRGNAETWEKRASGQIGYKGAMTKAYQNERILSIDVEMVHAGDRFEIHRGTHPDVLHEYGLTSERGDLVGGYCAARLGPKDAVPPVWKVTHMTIGEINAIRDEADSYRKWKNAVANGKKWHAPPWETAYEEMCKKTILVRACKTLPVGDAFNLALATDVDMRAHRVSVTDETKSTRTDDLKSKLGGMPAPEAVEAEFEESDPDEGP